MTNYVDDSYDHMVNHPHHGHIPGHDHPEKGMPYPGHPRWVPDNDDQLPIFSKAGRGLQGNSYVVRPKDKGNWEAFYLQGFRVDGVTGEETLEWESENIAGGYLHDINHTYRLRPFNDPPTFNLTFIYHRQPGSWAWTTPAIPYCWDEKGEYPEKMVGTGVATLFIRTDSVDHPDTITGKGNPKDDQWIEKLVYPDGTTRETFNAPDPLEEWTVNLTFGLLHGDILVPNIYDLAKIVGWDADTIYQVANDTPGVMDGSDNIKDYIDDQIGKLSEHLHKDMGFDQNDLTGDGGQVTIKKYIDGLFDELLKKIYPAGSGEPQYDTPAGPAAASISKDENGMPKLRWSSPDTVKIAQGNMNLYGGSAMENWIKTDEDGTNDVKAM